jgi:hypothetical protein
MARRSFARAARAAAAALVLGLAFAARGAAAYG